MGFNQKIIEINDLWPSIFWFLMMNQGWHCSSPFPYGLLCSESAGDNFHQILIFSTFYIWDDTDLFDLINKAVSC